MSYSVYCQNYRKYGYMSTFIDYDYDYDCKGSVAAFNTFIFITKCNRIFNPGLSPE